VRAARLAAHCLALLDARGAPIAVACPHAPRLHAALTALTPVAGEGQVPRAAVVAFLGAAATPAARQTTLRDIRDRLDHGAPLVLVDHNQPRSLWRRLPALVMLAAAGFSPARARYPAARELAVLGFVIERLRLACGERIQLITARRR
jgi:hypothetical protein